MSVVVPETTAPAGAAPTRTAFWGELAPCDHLVQIYEDETRFMETLERFVGEGLSGGEAVVLIATSSHLTWLESRLREAGCDTTAAREDDRLIFLDAASTLAEFMVDGWPDDERFFEVVGGIVARARHGGRHMRAFGEMVALLWAQGHNGATVRLEHLWNELIEKQALALFCAYPRIGATRDLTEALADVCAAHSKVCIA
ncbi:MAG: MEDS domain-containing protein [Luteimonas sp.]